MVTEADDLARLSSLPLCRANRDSDNSKSRNPRRFRPEFHRYFPDLEFFSRFGAPRCGPPPRPTLPASAPPAKTRWRSPWQGLSVGEVNLPRLDSQSGGSQPVSGGIGDEHN